MYKLIYPTMNGIPWVDHEYRDALRIFLFSASTELAAVLCMDDFGITMRSVM
ncbi:unnamed protein product [Penicillium roqueforti FM164]|uniref:Genomic scaffold, ProqFM164S04 n=1 Tax=Penicillium roqueforti (strain FM164) TaxID=1365484 RepID=W6QZX6_PENRF|nr:unnamed protein product [Penicillium roqueforti FM164]